jgi:hypothetical protein
MNDPQSRSWRVRLAISTVSMLSVGFALHCGAGRRDSDFAEPSWCQAAYPNECGRACTDDTGCAPGLHCGADRFCTAECGPNLNCPNGVSCSTRGQCSNLPTDGGPGFGDGGLDSGLPPDACAEVDVTIQKITPTVLLLVDQSQSMQDNEFPAGSGVTRWDALRSALIDPDGGIVQRLENDVSFGVTLYSWKAGDVQCPALVKIPWKIGNYTDIYNVYSTESVSDNTPTAESIMSVIGFDDAGVMNNTGFASATTPGPKILVLATDGDPDWCGDPNSNGTQPPRDFTEWATARTYSAGIPTYVISVDTEIDPVHQQHVANLGQGLPANQVADAAAVYRPTTKDELVTALNSVILGVRSCKFTLNGSVVSGTENEGSVTLNGTPLTYNDPNGWKLDSPTQLELVGTACNTLKTTLDAQVKVRFPCAAIVVPK